MREQAKALDETSLVPSEPVTVVLSERGWVRAAKGHEMDPRSLSYKSGDGFRAADMGRSNQAALFIDSTGRAYTLPAHSLPSARGQGEPLTGRLNPTGGASFRGVMLGDADTQYLLASDAGYGFVAKLGDLYSKNKSGKSVLSVPAGAQVFNPARVQDPSSDLVAAVSSEGRLLVHSVSDLPMLARGKGLKIIQIPPARLKSRQEFVVAVAVVPEGGSLTVYSGKRHLTLKPADLAVYRMERGRRGKKLPRGLQRVDTLEVDYN